MKSKFFQSFILMNLLSTLFANMNFELLLKECNDLKAGVTQEKNDLSQQLANLKILYNENLKELEIHKLLFTETLKFYEESLAPNKTDLGLIYYKIAEIHKSKGNIESALEYFSKSIKLRGDANQELSKIVDKRNEHFNEIQSSFFKTFSFIKTRVVNHFKKYIQLLSNFVYEMKVIYKNQIEKLKNENTELLKQLKKLKIFLMNKINLTDSSVQMKSKTKNIDYSKSPSKEIFSGHTESVVSLLKVSENLLASGSGDNTIKLWKLGSRRLKEIQTLYGHTSYVYCLLKLSETAFASGSYDGTIKIWKEVNGKFKETQTLTGHSSGVFSLLRISENLMASGSSDKSIKLWREEMGVFIEVQKLTGHDWGIFSLLKVSENLIASGSSDSTIILWKEENGKFRQDQTLLGHSKNVYCLLKVSQTLIVSGSYDNTIKLWREKNGKFSEVQTIFGHTSPVYSMLKLSDDVISSGYEDGSIKLWKEENGKFKEIQTLRGHIKQVYSMINISENTFASASKDKNIIIWEFNENIK